MRTTGYLLRLLAAALLASSTVRAAQQLSAIADVAPKDRIAFALYTTHNGVLKLTAQLYPLPDDAPRDVYLDIADRDGEWELAATAEIITPGWTAPFRVEPWDMTRDAAYRVRHGEAAKYTGTIRRDPADENVITVAAFTGNSIAPAHGGDIARDDIVENIRKIDPDLLFFSGDQVYDHTRHLAAWLKFGRDFGPILKDRPVVTIPDDHDVGQANLWGEEGGVASTPAGPDGGYFMPAEYVKEVERAQTSHLPDPFDPAPVGQGIGVYFTELRVGGISFAIIEDRKFKTGPEGVIPKMGPRPDHITSPDYDPAAVDVPEAQLLGERQLAFLDHWAQDWTGAEMKAVLSQTVFAGGAHLHGKHDARLYADLDSNGWPQTGRNKALRAMRKAFAFHLCGDQHLATLIHHGVDDWEDAGWSFCVPSIANLYLRWWAPLEAGYARGPGMPPHLGRFLDGFGNRVTMFAVANPEAGRNGGDKLTTRAAGFGIVEFNKADRTITATCWPRQVDVTAPDAKPYPGWPRTILQTDNYGRKPAGSLPAIAMTKRPNSVVQVVHEGTGDVVYTIRARGDSFRPVVFEPGPYTVHVGEGIARQTFAGVTIDTALGTAPLVVK